MRAAMEHMRESGGRTEHMGGMEGYGEKSAKGAHFEFVRGNARIDVTCAPRDSTEDCVDAAITLMDHIAMEKKEMAQAKAPQQPIPPGAPPPPPPPAQPQH